MLIQFRREQGRVKTANRESVTAVGNLDTLDHCARDCRRIAVVGESRNVKMNRKLNLKLAVPLGGLWFYSRRVKRTYRTLFCGRKLWD